MASASPRIWGPFNAGLLTALAGAIVLYWGREIFVPLVIATLIATLLLPLVARVERTGVRRSLAVVVVCATALMVVGGVVWVVMGQLATVAESLPDYFHNLQVKLRSAGLDRISGMINEFEPDVPPAPHVDTPASAEPTTPKAEPVPVRVVHGPAPLPEILFAARTLAHIGVLGVLAGVLAVCLLITWDDVRERVIGMVSRGRLTLTTKAMDDLYATISRLLLLQVLINVSSGVVIGLVLWALGVPNAALWGALWATFRWVPVLGPVVAALFPMALSLAASDGWSLPLSIGICCLLVEAIVGNVIEPVVFGGQGGVSILALLVCAAFWTLIWGLPGLLLSAPITIGLSVIGRHIPQLAWLGVLLGSGNALSAPERFYHRLVGLDREDALRIGARHHAEHGMLALFDDLCLPALFQARTDARREVLDEDHLIGLLELMREIIEGAVLQEGLNGKPRGTGGILCMGSSDEADELAAAMLSAALRKNGWAAWTLTADEVGTGLGEVIPVSQPRVVWISAIPPYAARQARLRALQIERRAPGTTVWIALWAVDRPDKKPEPAAPGESAPRSDSTPASIKEAVGRVSQLNPPASRLPSGETLLDTPAQTTLQQETSSGNV